MSVLTIPLKILLHSKMHSWSKSAKATTPSCRDEKKRDKREKSNRTKSINNFNNAITSILEEPGLWMRPEFQTLKNFVDGVSSNPAIFPKNTRKMVFCSDAKNDADQNLQKILVDWNTTHFTSSMEKQISDSHENNYHHKNIEW